MAPEKPQMWWLHRAQTWAVTLPSQLRFIPLTGSKQVPTVKCDCSTKLNVVLTHRHQMLATIGSLARQSLVGAVH